MITLAACQPSLKSAGARSSVPAPATTSRAASAGPSSSASTAPTATPTTAPAPATTPAAPAASVALSDCRGRADVVAALPAALLRELSVQCGSVEVPLDYSQPNGATIGISIVRIRSAQQRNRVGALLYNPGGPGASGIQYALGFANDVTQTLLTRFDLVGFDPRGVGLSAPLTCLSGPQKDAYLGQNPDVSTAAGLAAEKQVAQQLAQACATRYGAALADYNTVQTARDMDQIRKALGESQMNYLGFSYGTELGATYAHLFPDRVRVAVLDGALVPDADQIADLATYTGGFEAAFDQFAADCVTRSPCRQLGSPRPAVYALAARADANPIPGGGRRAGSATVLTAVMDALYSQSSWATLGAALLQAQRGNATGLFALADDYNDRNPNGTYDNLVEANTTITCNDSAPGPSDATIQATAASWRQKYPMFGLFMAASLVQCALWPTTRTVVPDPVATGAKPILVVGTLHDPATPYASTAELANELGVGTVLSWNGQGHTAYDRGSSCIDGYVNAYLINGTLPPANTTCQR